MTDIGRIDITTCIDIAQCLDVTQCIDNMPIKPVW